MLLSPQLVHLVGGINQIKNTYIPIWREGSSNRIWEGFEWVLFTDTKTRSGIELDGF